MKTPLLTLRTRIDALSLRERAILFLSASGVIVFLVFWTTLNPLYAQQGKLRALLNQQRNNIGGMDAEISKTLQAYAADPDAPDRLRLAALSAEAEAFGAKLRAVQEGLVAPDKMAPLLETILRANGRLRLVSLKTLPAGDIDPAATAAEAAPAPAVKPGTPAAKPGGLLYRHGVEIGMRGTYLDMIDFMAALESMPTQLFWGKAILEVEEYPVARLTLSLYTLSLDKKWIKL
ncbi:MAG: hypothetical protein Q8R69_09150 [Telluria sp.]|nr:hypothetical protein [Telluria sp.]